MKHLVWDTCVFGRYLVGDPSYNLSDIESFMTDVRKGERTVYFSTIMLAEIGRPLAASGKGLDILQFSQSLGANFVGVDPNPVILALAGEIHASVSTNPDPTQPQRRVVALGDAVHLATALYLQEVMQVQDVMFHTFDRGRGKTWEGRCVPLLGFDRWFPEATRTEAIGRVCSLSRSEPRHPRPSLPFAGAINEQPVSDRRH